MRLLRIRIRTLMTLPRYPRTKSAPELCRLESDGWDQADARGDLPGPFGRLQVVRGGGRQDLRFFTIARWRGTQTDDAIDPFAIVMSPRTFGQ
jgi:hypothetical protein